MFFTKEKQNLKTCGIISLNFAFLNLMARQSLSHLDTHAIQRKRAINQFTNTRAIILEGGVDFAMIKNMLNTFNGNYSQVSRKLKID
jgi:hypothetical protein